MTALSPAGRKTGIAIRLVAILVLVAIAGVTCVPGDGSAGGAPASTADADRP